LREVQLEYLAKFNFQLYQLLWYPIVFFVTYLPYLIFDLVRIFHNSDHDWVLWLIIIFSHPIGLYNALLFVFQRRLYRRQYEEYEGFLNEEDCEEEHEKDYEPLN